MDTSYVSPYSDDDDVQELVRFNYLHDARTKLRALRASTPQKSSKKFSRLLIDAIQHHQFDVLEFLLKEGVPVDARVVRAAAHPQTCERRREALSMLFRYGWDINRQLSGDEPPVLCKVLDDCELITWLLEQGADPNATCDIDESPLSHAISYASRPAIQLLLNQVSSLDRGQLMHCAIERKGADLELINILAQGGAPYDEILWQDPKSYTYRGHFTRGTPLHRACELDNVPVARALLDLGADPDKLSMKDNVQVPPTPRVIAYERKDRDMVSLFESCEKS